MGSKDLIAHEEIEVHGVAHRVRLQQAAEVCRKLGISEATFINSILGKF